RDFSPGTTGPMLKRALAPGTRLAASSSAHPIPGLRIAKHHHETSIHVVLLVAMEQRIARMIGCELYGGCAARGNQEDVLHQSSHTRTAHICNLDGVATQVDGGVVRAQVLHHQAIALAGM